MSAIPEVAARAALWWMDHKPFSAEAKARRKAKRASRKAKRSRQPDEVSDEVFQPEEGSSMFWKGKKTYSGIATIVVGLVLGWLGFGDCDPATAVDACVSANDMTDRIMAAVNEIIMIVGVVWATYGRIVAKPAK